MRAHKAAAAAAIALIIAFTVGVYGLFHLRFEAGDVYPAYSTFRADPLGSRALYESVALQPGLTVTRNLRPLRNVRGRGTTLFLLGLEDGWPLQMLETSLGPEMERVAREGGRIVVAFVPERPSRMKLEPGKPAKPKAPAKPPLFEQLGVRLQHDLQTTPAEVSGDPPRRTALWFDNLSPEWAVVRQYAGHPVLIERPWHNGSIVLITDSWMLSNEALSSEPDAPMLARLTGPNHTLIFDEAHLGIQQSGSVAGLLRKYHLQGVIAVLLVLAALFIWKNASPFLPRETSSGDDRTLRGHSAGAGLISLLERSVPPGRLMEVCAKEYQAGRNSRLSEPQRGRLEETMRECERSGDAVAAYERVRKTLEEIRHPWKQTSSS